MKVVVFVFLLASLFTVNEEGIFLDIHLDIFLVHSRYFYLDRVILG